MFLNLLSCSSLLLVVVLPLVRMMEVQGRRPSSPVQRRAVLGTVGV